LKINKVAIVSKFGSKKSEQAAEGIVEKLLKQKFKVYTVSPVLVKGAEKVNSLEDLRKIKLDLVITLGGDGTTLRTFRNLENETPLLAINVGGNRGILSEINLDEIDKVSARSDRIGGDVSREGVQRDLLPLIEGTTVSTKYGTIKTDHILFIASGAFQLAKPSDLLPELQGRLPIRVELNALTSEDFKKILREPDNSLIKQYKALLKTEKINLEFTDDGIETIAELATEVNSSVENIGARRLHTIIEKVLDEISFTATDRSGEKIIIDKKYVQKNLGELVKDTDLSKFIL